MWFWVYWSSGPRKQQQGRGYINCPLCASRQPAELFQFIRTTYLYGIVPLSSGQPEGPETYRCLTCSRQFVSDGSYGYDFSEEAARRTWQCFKCDRPIPYERFDCPHSGYRFDPTR